MLQSLLIVGTIYLIILISISVWQRKKGGDSKSYLLAGGNLGSVLGLFTFAATLFSTFTLLGMPDFFRTHGVGAWTFLAVADMAMIFGVIWAGFYFRKKALKGGNYWGMAGFLTKSYGQKFAGRVAFFGVFVFLIPYVAIQIKGVSDFLNQAFPGLMPIWAWSVAMVVVMMVYSEIGGLKAIIYNDAIQGLILLIVIWIVGMSCLDSIGGLEEGFRQIEAKEPALLSTPGPKGLFSVQFLIGSAVAILMIPFTQPQVSVRLAIMKDNNAMYRMAVGVGTFAILVILPTVFIGMYGALKYPELSAFEFLGKALITDQPKILAAFVLIGLMAAAISTADSQVFALGTELRSILKGTDEQMLRTTKIGIVVFAIIALIFSINSSDQLALLALMSFKGTALLAPMIFSAIFYDQVERLKYLPAATLIGLLIFIGTLVGLLPAKVLGLGMELVVIIVLALFALGSILAQRKAVA